MSGRFGTSTWSVLVPEGWRASHGDGFAELMSDAGAIHISCAFKDSEIVDADLRELAAAHIDAGARTKPTTAGDFEGFEFAFGDGERFCRHWYLRNRRQAVFITYNCEISSRGMEDEVVRSVLTTLTSLGHGVA